MRLRRNLLRAELGADITNVGVAITFVAALQEGGVDIPTVAAPDYMSLTIDDEVIYLTAYVTGTLIGTISRGEEDTAAAGHTASAVIRNTPTKEDFFTVAPSALPGWLQDNVAASQTAVALIRAVGHTDVPAPAAGSIIGIAVHSNAARAAGTLTVDATIGGTSTGLTALLDGTNTTDDQGTDVPGAIPFIAGDLLGVEITTTGAWAPTTADIDVSLLVVFDLA